MRTEALSPAVKRAQDKSIQRSHTRHGNVGLAVLKGFSKVNLGLVQRHALAAVDAHSPPESERELAPRRNLDVVMREAEDIPRHNVIDVRCARIRLQACEADDWKAERAADVPRASSTDWYWCRYDKLPADHPAIQHIAALESQMSSLISKVQDAKRVGGHLTGWLAGWLAAHPPS